MTTRVRYHHETDNPGIVNRGIVLLEAPPQVRLARSNGSFYTTGSPMPVRLPFPYSVYVVSYQVICPKQYKYGGIYDRGLYVYMRDRPLTSWEDPVVVSPLENQRSGLSCTTHRYDGRIEKSVKNLVQFALGLWWGSTHVVENSDLIRQWAKIDPQKIETSQLSKNSCSLRTQITNDDRWGLRIGPPYPLPADAPLIDIPLSELP